MKVLKLKKMTSILLALLLVVTLTLPTFASTPSPYYIEEVRGVWISFLEMKTMLENKSEEEFTANITAAMENIYNYGLNTVYVQVRPYSDALYKSQYFPWSHTITGTEGKDPGFDPLEIMIKEAHRQGIKIEAWINPYRVRPQGNVKGLSTTNPARIWLETNDRAVLKQGTLISYNPASVKAQNLIVNGVREIVRNYDIDGIHIDDYFYPYTGTDFDKTFDTPEYNTYVKKGGKLSHGDWRRSNVETLIQKIYKGVKEEKPAVLFGISPQSSISNNYNQQYFDVKKIAAGSGYCDYLAPQIYFGFENGTQPFGKTLDEWDNLIVNKDKALYVGIATYKIGTVDNYAGAGKNEWATNTNQMARMVTYAREKTNYKGFALYRYDHLFKPENTVVIPTEKENNNLRKIL